MILFLRGVDQIAIRRRMQQLRDEADGGSGMLSTNLTVLDGREAKPGEILGAALTPPFLWYERGLELLKSTFPNLKLAIRGYQITPTVMVAAYKAPANNARAGMPR